MSPRFVSLDGENLNDVLATIGDLVFVADEHMTFIATDDRYAALYGKKPEDILGHTVWEFYPDFKKSVFYQACQECIDTGQTISRFGYSTHAQKWVVIRAYKMRDHRYAMVIHQLGEHAMEGYGTFTDELTSLPNRRAFERDFEQIRGYGQHDIDITLIDVNQFKQINESLGFSAGDKCLMSLAAVIKKVVDAQDRVYRMSADQFLVLGSGTEEKQTSRREALRAHVLRPRLDGLEDHMIQCHLAYHVSDAQESCKDAIMSVEQALRLAKIRHNTEESSKTKSGLQDVSNPKLAKDISDALDQGQMSVFVQPYWDLLANRIPGAEALIRWKKPDGHMLAPGLFLKCAEDHRLMRKLDRYMLSRVIEWLGQTENSHASMYVSVNLSAQSLIDQSLPEWIRSQLLLHRASPKRLCVEIVENALIQEQQVSEQVVESMKAQGIHVAIDDFGSGFASMAYLLRYSAHILKIDRSFVSTMLTSEVSATVVKNIIQLAHGMKMWVVAEGVETEQEQIMLGKMGCDLIQGYGFARPMPLEEFPAWLEEHHQNVRLGPSTTDWW